MVRAAAPGASPDAGDGWSVRQACACRFDAGKGPGSHSSRLPVHFLWGLCPVLHRFCYRDTGVSDGPACHLAQYFSNAPTDRPFAASGKTHRRERFIVVAGSTPEPLVVFVAPLAVPLLCGNCPRHARLTTCKPERRVRPGAGGLSGNSLWEPAGEPALPCAPDGVLILPCGDRALQGRKHRAPSPFGGPPCRMILGHDVHVGVP